MLTDGIEVPAPSRFVSNEKVDEIATRCNQAYRTRRKGNPGYPVDMDRFIDLLEVPVIREEIEEPEDAAFFASYTPEDGGLITVNSRHEELFVSRPDVYAACLGHEAGHRVLRHSEQPVSDDDASRLPNDVPSHQQRLLHKSSWHQYGLSRDEVGKMIERRNALRDRLVRNALVNEKARQALEQMNNRFEPEWMFRQAEHFSLCLRIPHDCLSEMLKEGWDFTGWAAVYRLAERFGVSGTMMKIRLLKLRVLEVGADGSPRPCPPIAQVGLFD